MPSPQRTLKPLHISLWVSQALLALLFIGSGLFKLVTPIPTLAQMWSWAGEYPNLLRLEGVGELSFVMGLYPLKHQLDVS